MSEDLTSLLKSFTRDRSETAFRGLVRQHSPLVFGTALRFLKSDRAAAQDVTQEVFTLLARKASSLEADQLSGWLYRQTCRRASNHIRAESRRRIREYAAVEAMTPPSASSEFEPHHLSSELDEAMIALPARDRDALVLRYFEDRDFRTVGGVLGITEEAARKRVNRAMEKLVAMLRRRGITIGTASLSGTMTSMGRTTVSEKLVAQISAHALKGLPAAGWPALMSLLKPFLSGVALSSLLIGSSEVLLQANDGVSVMSRDHGGPVPTTKIKRGDSFAALPDTSSLQSIIAAIKQSSGGPRHELGTLRLKAILARISNEQIPEFVALANGELSDLERTTVYPLLIYRWAEADAAAAISFAVLGDLLTKHLDPALGTSMRGSLFSDWLATDLPAMEDWLKRNWNHESLLYTAANLANPQQKPLPLRDSIAMAVAKSHLWKDGKEGVLAYLNALPSPQDRLSALGAFSNQLYWQDSNFEDVERQATILDLIKSVPEKNVRDAALDNYLAAVARGNPETFPEFLESLEPRDRFHALVKQLGIPKIQVQIEGVGNTSYTDEEALPSPLKREAEVLEAGRAAGLPESEIAAEVAKSILPALSREEFGSWIQQHRDNPHLDEALAAGIRGATEPERGIEIAAAISEVALRQQLARASFRRLLVQNRRAAMAYPSRADVPADLAEEFRNILGETP
ncbi:RNA polymerase sigma factor [Luteolibacter luteus]|uniref:Sigma-70 family RNA polymerase sigma factor n=1 Tax=Luteolibacter luteus TaxID=2728835 RepID=A0A858RQ89_9BACT|nr:sigma-70 family RNA polymerase sigma factor [Luteolibacter luteus]QJE98093.1 sigma-70 family RNA polymerase sigma factor [Luteolibacter luteus]